MPNQSCRAAAAVQKQNIYTYLVRISNTMNIILRPWSVHRTRPEQRGNKIIITVDNIRLEILVLGRTLDRGRANLSYRRIPEF